MKGDDIIKRKAYLLHKKLMKRLHKKKNCKYRTLNKNFVAEKINKYCCDEGILEDFLDKEELKKYYSLSAKWVNEEIKGCHLINKYMAFSNRNDIIFNNYDGLSWKRKKNRNSISKNIPYENEYLYNNFTGFNRAISFSVNKLANGLSNKLMQGDIISLIIVDTSNQRSGNEIATIPEELKYIEVLTTTNNIGIDTENVDTKENDNKLYQTVTVLVCDEQAKIIASAESSKLIYTELVYRQGNKNIASYFLNKQSKILDKLYPDRIDPKEKEDIENLLKIEIDKENNDITVDENQIDEIETTDSIIDKNENQESEMFDNDTNNEIDENINMIDEETKELINETIKETDKETINPEKEEYERIKKEYGIVS